MSHGSKTCEIAKKGKKKTSNIGQNNWKYWQDEKNNLEKMLSQKKNEECENWKFNSAGRNYLNKCFLNT